MPGPIIDPHPIPQPDLARGLAGMGPGAAPGRAAIAQGDIKALHCHRVRARRGGLQPVDHRPHLDGPGDIGGHMAAAFGLIALQKRAIPAPPAERGQFPGQIGRVADPRAHALAQKGRHQMRRIPGNGDAIRCPTAGVFGFERIDRRPFQIGIFGGDPTGKAPPDRRRLVHLDAIFPGAQGKFPTPPIAGIAAIGGRGGRIAELHGEIAEIGPGPTQAKIDHQPALFEPGPVPSGIDMGGDNGSRAVASDDITRPIVAAGPARTGLMVERGAGCVFFDGGDLPPQAYLDRSAPRQRRPQHPFQIRLMKPIAGMPAKICDRLGAGPIDENPPIPIDKAHAGISNDLLRQRIGTTDGLKDPHHLVVEMDRAG